MVSSTLFGGLNFASIADDPNFKEDSVRDEIILPILKRLGYKSDNIIRSKPLLHQIGTKKHQVRSIPDYILAIGGYNAFVLDAKAPNQVITEGDNVEQAFSYAMQVEFFNRRRNPCSSSRYQFYRKLCWFCHNREGLV